MFASECKIVSVTLTDAGNIEVIKQYPSNRMLACNPPRPGPDRVTKEIYAAVQSEIELIHTIEGKHTPATMVEEKIEFD